MSYTIGSTEILQIGVYLSPHQSLGKIVTTYEECS